MKITKVDKVLSGVKFKHLTIGDIFTDKSRIKIWLKISNDTCILLGYDAVTFMDHEMDGLFLCDAEIKWWEIRHE